MLINYSCNIAEVSPKVTVDVSTVQGSSVMPSYRNRDNVIYYFLLRPVLRRPSFDINTNHATITDVCAVLVYQR